MPDNRIVYSSSDKVGLELQHIQEDLHIKLNLISRSPLTSTLTANTSDSNLYGTTVFCLDEIDSSESEYRASIAVHGMLTPLAGILFLLPIVMQTDIMISIYVQIDSLPI